MSKIRNLGLLLALSSVAVLPACSWFGGNNGSERTSSASSARSNYGAAQQPAVSSQQAEAQQPLSADTIRQVQQSLQQQGLYHAGPDGVWGPRTEAAVRSFQQKNNINPTGQLDQQTLASLNVGNQQNYGNNNTNPQLSNQASDNGQNVQPRPNNLPSQQNAQSNQQNGNVTR
jgi:peptidoglycan hydrolase-like protein with peptidoglycan-binding domain